MDVAMPPLQIRWLSQPNLRQCRAMDRFGGDEFQHTSQYLPTAMVQEFRVVDQSQKMQKAHALSRCKSNQNRNPSGSSPNSPHTTRLSRFQILQELASLCLRADTAQIRSTQGELSQDAWQVEGKQKILKD